MDNMFESLLISLTVILVLIIINLYVPEKKEGKKNRMLGHILFLEDKLTNVTKDKDAIFAALVKTKMEMKQ
jgi:hypothetical protein